MPALGVLRSGLLIMLSRKTASHRRSHVAVRTSSGIVDSGDPAVISGNCEDKFVGEAEDNGADAVGAAADTEDGV